MISFWTRRRSGHRAGKHELSGGSLDMEHTIPTHFRCPISLDLMKDPVTLATGITYDRESIEKWIEAGNQKCPVTNQVLINFDQIPNHSLRKMIQDWCVQNRSNGVERIPTPIIPVAKHEVLEIGSRIMVASRSGDAKKCVELVGKIKRWARESKRNKKCVVENGTGSVFAASFELFAANSVEKHAVLLMEILSALVWMFPLGTEGQRKLGSGSALRCMAWFLKGDDLSARQTAVSVLKELFSLNQQSIIEFAKIEGVADELIRIIEEPISPTASKASLMVIYHMISTSEEMIKRFVEMGLISLILEILVDAERSTCEKALGVLEGLFGGDEGIKEARNHGLTVPVLVKKILRVSNMATEFSVSALLKLCKSKEGGEEVMIEALQVGGFQKLLLVLQVGCGEGTKEKATELLKLLNQYRDRLLCVDSSDFKYLKRSY